MKKFILHIALFSILILSAFVWVFTNVDGYSDPYYLRFTSPKQSSFILGISKAAQGLHPNVFNKVLNRNDMFNYSFTISRSPYGKTYLESVKKKLNHETKNGIFILTVDAWSLCSNTENPNDSTNFSENSLCLSNDFVSINPNIPYLINYYPNKFIDIFREKQSALFLHNNGWLEVNIDIDSISCKKRVDRNYSYYTENYLPKWKYSEVRYSYFNKTINYLKNFGKVYLVRLPIHKRILELENKLLPNIDSLIQKASSNNNVDYFNFSDSLKNYQFTDGLHLTKRSGARISIEIASLILKN